MKYNSIMINVKFGHSIFISFYYLSLWKALRLSHPSQTSCLFSRDSAFDSNNKGHAISDMKPPVVDHLLLKYLVFSKCSVRDRFLLAPPDLCRPLPRHTVDIQ